MRSTKIVFLGCALLLGIMHTTARFEAVDQNATPANVRNPQAAKVAISTQRTILHGGAAAADSSPSEVKYYPHQQVAETFTKASTLYDGDGGKVSFQVHASHRDGPGEAEIHLLDNDVFYIVKGTATQVTGGKISETHTIRPNELRATSIEGGVTRQLSQGDVIIIPKGTPHWFKEVPGNLQYLVIKIR